MTALIHDVRYGLRMLRKNPGSTLVAVIALGFGIGANTSIFSVVNGILLRPLPYGNSDRLVVVWETKLSKGKTREQVSPANYRDWREQNRAFDQIAALRVEPRVLTGGEWPERVETGSISTDTFDVLGVKAALGRTFSPDEGQPGRNRVAVLSHGLWQRRFGADRNVLGKAATLDGEICTIVGVMPPEFRMLDTTSELWIPYTLDASELSQRGYHTLRVMARLKPGVSLDQAQSDMHSVANHLEREYRDSNAGYSTNVVLLRDQMVGDIRSTLWALLGAVVCVLLIACANVANLLLARAGSRDKEIALRAALGANPGRLARQLFTESVVLAAAGGLLGLLLAAWSTSLLQRIGPATLPRLKDIAIDWRVLLFTLAVSLATGIVFGLAPVYACLRNDLNSTLKASGRGTAGSRTRARLRDALVVSEVASCVVLLTGAGLLLRSFARLQGVSPGFRPDHVLTLQFTLPETRYSNWRVATYHQTLLERLRALPAVQFAGIASRVPLIGEIDRSLNFIVEHRPVETSADQPRAQYRAVSPGYFEALGVQLLRGRTFDRSDGEKTPGVALINDALARRFFPGEDPLGKRIKAGLDDSVWCTIVGIVADVKHVGLDAVTNPETYYHYLQVPPPLLSMVEGTMTVVLRANAEPYSLAASARGEIQKLDGDLAVFNVKTMQDLVAGSLAQPRFRTILLGAFAGLALTLAAIGLYGVIAYSVAQRTNELGVRMALGAQKNDVLRLVVGHAALLAAAGIAIGLAMALGTVRLLSNLLFAVRATDPLTFAASALLILLVALGASTIPALRAIHVDPVEALRYE